MKIRATEQQLKKSVVELLNTMGHFAWATNTGTFFFTNREGKQRMFKSGVKGQADVLGVLKGGRFLAIELKVGYNKPTPAQETFLEQINRRGGLGFVARSIEEVQNYVR